MIKVVLLGSGNVANHLLHAFTKAEAVDLVQVYARDIHKIEAFQHETSITDSVALLKKADVYVLAVSDDAIQEVSATLSTSALVVHTSGTVPLEKLQNQGKRGVFYPLQSFTKNKPVNFKDIPFCLETEDPADMHLLEKLALAIGEKVYYINSEQRKYLHVAAVFVNNFTNHMYRIGYDLCAQYNVPFAVLLPLIKETADKVQDLTPKQAQTGPAKRQDKKTIANHLALLNTEQQNIYNLLTEAIINGEKL